MGSNVQVAVYGLPFQESAAALEVALTHQSLTATERDFLQRKRQRLLDEQPLPQERTSLEAASVIRRRRVHDSARSEKLKWIARFREAGAFDPNATVIPYSLLERHPRREVLLSEAHSVLADSCELGSLKTYFHPWKLWSRYASEHGYAVHVDPTDPTPFNQGLSVYCLELGISKRGTASAVESTVQAIGYVAEKFNGHPRPTKATAGGALVQAERSAFAAHYSSAPHQMRPFERWMRDRSMDLWGKVKNRENALSRTV